MPEQESLTHFPIKPESLLEGTTNYVDLYQRKANNTLEVLYRSGRPINEKFKEILADRRVLVLYVDKADKFEYLNYVTDNLEDIIAQDSIHENTKVLMVNSAVKTTSEIVLKSPGLKSIRRHKHAVNIMVDMLVDNPLNGYKLMKVAPHSFSLYNHSANVGLYATMLAISILGNKDIFLLKKLAHGFYMHDIGQSGMPLSIIHQRKRLTKEDWQLVGEHPMEGVRTLRKANELTDETEVIILQHHERNSGVGYPKGLQGNSIHLFAKICTLADVFEAMTSKRPYRTQLSTFQAFKMIRDEMSDEFRPDFFEKLVNLFHPSKFEKIADFTVGA